MVFLLRLLDTVAQTPIDVSEFVGTLVCKVPFKHIPQPLTRQDYLCLANIVQVCDHNHPTPVSRNNFYYWNDLFYVQIAEK